MIGDDNKAAKNVYGINCRRSIVGGINSFFAKAFTLN